MSGPTHYELLRVAPTASREELRQAFRALSKRYHPDTTELPAAEAERAFRQLRQAYAVLTDPIARQRYDLELRQGAMAVAMAVPAAPAAASVPRSVTPRSEEVRRALSGGEWLALLLLGVALIFSLVLGVGLALARGAEVVQWPSWWKPADADTASSAPGSPALATSPLEAPALAPEAPPG